MYGHIFDSYGRIDPAAIKAAGGQGKARYFSHTPDKNLIAQEVTNLLALGMTIVTVWEQQAQAPEHGGYVLGLADGKSARAQATAVGLGPNAVCYCMLDDPSPAPASSYPIIAEYAHGFKDGYSNGDGSVIGGYGSHGATAYAKAAGHIAYTWVPDSWGATADDNLIQLANRLDLPAVAGTDQNRIMTADYGQWPRPASPVVIPPILSLGQEARMICIPHPTIPLRRDYIWVKSDWSIWHRWTGADGSMGPGSGEEDLNGFGYSITAFWQAGHLVAMTEGVDGLAYERESDGSEWLTPNWLPLTGIHPAPPAKGPAGPSGPSGASGVAGPAYDDTDIKAQISSLNTKQMTAGQALSAA